MVISSQGGLQRLLLFEDMLFEHIHGIGTLLETFGSLSFLSRSRRCVSICVRCFLLKNVKSSTDSKLGKKCTKCCNLHHFALSDGKDLRKVTVLTRKVAKTLLFIWFLASHGFRFFQKRVSTRGFYGHDGLQAFGAITRN